MDGHTWEDPDEAGDIETLKSHASSLPVEAASEPQSEELNPVPPEETVMASPEEVSLKDTADVPQDLPHHFSLLVDL